MRNRMGYASDTFVVILISSPQVEALGFLHANNIVHRDVQPENIMVGQDGHVVLGNFANARLQFSTYMPTSHVTSVSGSPKFHAPEIILGWNYDFSVDCWGLGITLHYMLYSSVRIILLLTLIALDPTDKT